MTAGSAIVVICAMPSEAAPIAARWRLRCVRREPFTVYRGGRRTVIVSGIGAHASAAAVGYAAALHARATFLTWCNAGIAGHGELPVGTAVTACSVAPAGGRVLWHPFVLASPSCRALPCLTYDAAVTDYPDRACCEMEAAGFLAALARVSTADVATVFKVVSDNRASGLERIVRARVDELMASRLDELDAVIEASHAATGHRAVIATHLAPLLARTRFTRTQQRQLHELAVRLHGHAAGTWQRALPDDENDPAVVLAALRTALPQPALRD